MLFDLILFTAVVGYFFYKVLMLSTRPQKQLCEKKSIIEATKGELDTSAGCVRINNIHYIPINIPAPNKLRNAPKAKRFKIKEDSGSSDSSSLPESSGIVPTHKYDDETFKCYFTGPKTKLAKENLNTSLNDYDNVSNSAESLLVQKKDIKVLQRMKSSSKNALKVVAARSDIQNEYTEVITDTAEKDKEAVRQNIQKLAKRSHLAIEAIAALASKEDFASVSLKRVSGLNGSYLPFKSLMLLQVKGRIHVQTRLVEPVAASINQGDNYILITPKSLYHYVGPYSNTLEKSRASDIVNHIYYTADMGCNVDAPIIINIKKNRTSKDLENFWNHLGVEESALITPAGHPDEDEYYESNIVDTNMIYILDSNELVPLANFWGAIPKVEMLEPSKVLVFDFGTELYVWSGKNVELNEKRAAFKLAKQLWDGGYDYTDCNVCPLNVSKLLGARDKSNQPFKFNSRPKWALLAKITQHKETILFREKFIEWPNNCGVKKLTNKNSTDTIDIKSCDINTILKATFSEPDLEVGCTHLARGRNYYDKETNRHFEINTLEITRWIMCENYFDKLDARTVRHFYDADTYIVRWNFAISVSGRQFSGKPSKYSQIGSNRCLYFYWIGENATKIENDTTAFLAAGLDLQSYPQIQVNQGSEPAAFLQLFDGKMFVHFGKRGLPKNRKRLYICRGEIEHETALFEVPCKVSSLRSRASFILIQKNKVTVWNGAKSLEKTRNLTKSLAAYIFNLNSSQACPKPSKMIVMEEGMDMNFLKITSEKRRLYNSLIESENVFACTPRLFHYNSISGSFKVTEILCPHRSEHTTPYPFVQSELYSVSQPALFLIDNEHELWLWQGWLPEREAHLEPSEQNARWQKERKVAMKTALEYWKALHGESKNAYLVWAGLEPLSFTNLFPFWCDRDDVAKLNAKDGKGDGNVVLIENEFAVLTRPTYTLDELLQHPLPHGADSTQLEIYLSSEEFASFFSMSREEFYQLRQWKQEALKKEMGLF